MFSKLCILFFGDELKTLSEVEKEKIDSLTNLIQLHGYSSHELILQYFQDKVECQSALGKIGPHGTLTLLADYCTETEVLRLKILNATMTTSGGEPDLKFTVQKTTRFFIII